MFNPRYSGYGPYGDGPYGGGRRRGLAASYNYERVQGYEGTQASSLISKVMGLLAFSFVFAFIGGIVGLTVIHLTLGSYLFVAIAGLIVLLILNFAINVDGLNLFLLYLFTFLEGLALSPILLAYTAAGYAYLLLEAFLLTAVASLGLAIYAWTTKRDFSGLGSKLFLGLLLLIGASILGIFFHSTLFELVIAVGGVALFSAYVLFNVQRAKYLADTLPNAIGLTVSIFITVLNLFLYILEILTILQGGRSRR
jgi:FtsH-binding integral membrane protein